jgi:hypothetical protein
MTTSIDTRIAAARDALHTHDQLRQVEAAGDRFSLGSDGLPLDSAGWLTWHQQQYRPALAAWQQAMQLLALALGPEFPGRHPHRWRPVCELILTRADAAAQTAARTDRHTDDASDGAGSDADGRDPRAVLLARIGGENKAVRAEQARARGVPDRMIARRIGVGLATVRAWFHVQDQLLLDDDTDDDETVGSGHEAALEFADDPHAATYSAAAGGGVR